MACSQIGEDSRREPIVALKVQKKGSGLESSPFPEHCSADATWPMCTSTPLRQSIINPTSNFLFKSSTLKQHFSSRNRGPPHLAFGVGLALEQPSHALCAGAQLILLVLMNPRSVAVPLTSLTVGQRLQVGNERATVRYIGPVDGQSGEWAGLEWDNADRGKHDGTVGGRSYFTCVFVGA